jgi:hypothetical protein
VADEVDLNVLAEIETSGTHGKARPFRVAKAKPKSAEIEVESEDDELERKVMKMAKWVVIVVFAIILFLIIRHFVLKMKSKEGSFRRDPQRSALVFASGWRTNEHFDRAERHHEKTFPSMAFACASDRVARLPACASLAHFSACLGGGQG